MGKCKEFVKDAMRKIDEEEWQDILFMVIIGLVFIAGFIIGMQDL